MLDNVAVVNALRNHLLMAEFATTGVTTLAATGTGFTRAAGSFTDDGFRNGMEVIPAGFADNSVGVIRAVTDTEITLIYSRTEEPADAGRSLTVGIPALRGWENEELDLIANRWYIEEDYLPGPTAQVTVGIKGELEHLPTYVLRFGGLAGSGIDAVYEVADGLLEHFPPRLALATAAGDLIRVRSEPAPYRGQVLQREGRAEVAVTFPLMARTSNPI